jgi:predicted dehydrogenase
VYGTEGAAFADRDGASLRYQRRGESGPTEIALTEIDAVADQLADFANSILNGSRPEVSGVEGLAVVAVLEAAQRSASSGCFETVDTG